VSAHSEYFIRQKSQPLADLMDKTAELERQLDDVRMSLECELGQPARSREAAPGQIQDTYNCAIEDVGREHDADTTSDLFAAPTPSHGHPSTNSAGQVRSPGWRTEVLVNEGRHSAYHPGLSRGRKVAIGSAVAAALVTILVMMLSTGGASWPPSVATVQNEADKACQNPDVKSEPGQVNFACTKATRQILWVFALITSANNPSFADTKTGRLGLEPIAPVQGGAVASSLNLHHPYDPSNPIDSIEVAARALNDIIGGATMTGANGNPVVQSGLESSAANCRRYTGSAALNSRQGFPDLCARPVTSPAGQAALVADVYRKWIVGAPAEDAQDAVVLFQNADNPGNPRVQSILNNQPNLKFSP
jgi:hypothetical protein